MLRIAVAQARTAQVRSPGVRDPRGGGSVMLRQILAVLSNHVGAVPNPISAGTRQAGARVRGATVTNSICPYCAVGCAQLVYVKDGRIVDIEGSYDSPINGGTLCPKGAATLQLAVNPHRLTTVKYRAPYSDHWEERPLSWAMERIAQLVKQTRDESFEERGADGADGDESVPVMRTFAIGHFGGATLDNEENYLIKKLFGAGLGVVHIENQARI
jgi:formate dehydrogenase major subunit